MRRLAYCIVLAAGLSAGCSGSGNRSSVFSPAHPLIPQARSLKSAYPDPLAVPRELNKGVTPPYVVEPGDVLSVQPAKLDSPVSLPGDQPVLPDGRIHLGTYGQLQVAGRTVDQIEADVNALVRANTKDVKDAKDVPAVIVRVVTRDSKVFYVLGEVNAPGAFPLRGRETVLDAIVAAGGLNSNASRNDIVLSRPTEPPSCRLVLPVCYNEIVQLGDTTTNYQVRPGDRVFVPTRGLHETLCPTKSVCPPCGRPQEPCPIPALGEKEPPAPPPANAPPAVLPAPVKDEPKS